MKQNTRSTQPGADEGDPERSESTPAPRNVLKQKRVTVTSAGVDVVEAADSDGRAIRVEIWLDSDTTPDGHIAIDEDATTDHNKLENADVFDDVFPDGTRVNLMSTGADFDVNVYVTEVD